MKATTIVLIAVALAFVWLLFFGGRAQVEKTISVFAAPPSPELAAFEQKYGGDFIYYNDSNYSFSIKYPIGYNALYQPEIPIYLRFYAVNPSGSNEVIDVYVYEQEYTATDFENDLKKFPLTNADYSQQVIKKEETEINGRHAFVAEINHSIAGGESFLVKTAAINCGSYTAAVVASIPDTVLADRIVAEYMIRSFRC